MRLKFVFLFLIMTAFLYPKLLYGQAPVCEHIANYKMDVELLPEKKTVEGSEVLTWLNDSYYYVDELYFHLYMNAFKNNKSSFMKESGRPLKKDIKPIELGYCDIISMKVLENDYMEEADITSTIEFVQPDDDNKDDQTVIRVKLPRVVPPNGEVQLIIDFATKLPRTIRRSGYYQDYFFMAQWFPKIGVFWDGKWNCHQYHSSSEFFADYGIYDVNITVPTGYIVGATGEKRTAIENPNGTTTYNFYQESVHDFAWTACEDYIEKIEKYPLPSGRSIDITLLIMPEHQKQSERYLTATKHAVKYYSEWYGEYPYSTVTVVDPAYRSGAGGMEYPTFFTGGTSWIESPKGVLRPEGVTVHEFGHGYWYGLVGNNEFEDAWLDEGFNSFSESEVLETAYGPGLFSTSYFGFPVVFPDVKYEQRFSGLDGYRRIAKQDIMQRNAWEYMTGSSYTVNAYDKPELMLRTLKNYLGKKVFDNIMMTYSQRWWYKHPKPQDFFEVVGEVSGKNMNWFFDQFVYGSDVLDYSIDRISSRLEPEPVGILTKWGRNFAEKETAQKKEEEKIEPDTTLKAEELKKKEEKEKIYTCEVLVRRLGEVKMPVEIQVNFDNGETITESWDGQYRWKKFIYKKPAKIKSAVVDPEHKYVLDINYTNNSKIAIEDNKASLKWTSKWMFWLQNLLELFAFFS